MKIFLKISFSLITGIGLGLLGFIASKSITSHKPPVTVVVEEIRQFVHPQIRFGFLPYWLIDQAEPETLKAMTHVAYFGLVISPDGHIQTRVNPREEEPGWTTLRTQKLKNAFAQAKNSTRSLVVHLANEGDITQLLTNPRISAENLVKDVTPVMKNYGFTDLNLDIESFRKASPEAQLSFTEFVRTVKDGVDADNLGTLSIDVLPRAFITDFLLKPEQIIDYVDHTIVMAYDYSYSGSQYSGPVAPLGGVPTERTLDVPVTISEAIRVIPKDKLVIGFPLYGYEWESLSAICPGPVIPGTGKTASAKRTAALLSGCPDCTLTTDPVSQSDCIVQPWPDSGYYAHIYSENADSLKAKLDFTEKLDLAGSAFWALGYESEEMIGILIKK